MFPSASRAHWGHHNPYNYYAPPPPHVPHAAPVASGPVYINAATASRFQRRAPRRLVWFTIGSLATLWWMNKRSSSNHFGGEYGWSHSTTRALPAPPAATPAPAPAEAVAVQEDRTRDSQGRRFGWRREERRKSAAAEEEERKKAEAKVVLEQTWAREKKEMEERWKVEGERMKVKAEEAKEKVRDFAATRLDEMLAALTELKKDLKPAPPAQEDPNAPRYFV